MKTFFSIKTTNNTNTKYLILKVCILFYKILLQTITLKILKTLRKMLKQFTHSNSIAVKSTTDETIKNLANLFLVSTLAPFTLRELFSASPLCPSLFVCLLQRAAIFLWSVRRARVRQDRTSKGFFLSRKINPAAATINTQGEKKTARKRNWRQNNWSMIK